MASSAGPSSDRDDSALSADSSRPQAGPLPLKRGEIGFNEELHAHLQSTSANTADVTPLPERHPADRDASPAAVTDADPEAQAEATPPSGTPSEAHTPPPQTETTSTHSTGKSSFVKFFRSKHVPTYGGIRLTTLLLTIFQLLLVCGTIAGWILSAIRIAKDTKNANNSDTNQTLGAASSGIFVNVLFAVGTVVELIFLERRFYRMRAERWMYLHPGEMMPSRGSGRPSSVSMGFAPWNRPPLPTYARALADSGFGTGDVEDHIIAAPPPPAYGNTRGSTLILAGFLRESLRAERPASERTQAEVATTTDRPVSYMSADEQWEEIQDAERARRLEETLATLEERPGSAARSNAR
jgi:hypothetical protein